MIRKEKAVGNLPLPELTKRSSFKHRYKIVSVLFFLSFWVFLALRASAESPDTLQTPVEALPMFDVGPNSFTAMCGHKSGGQVDFSPGANLT